MPSGTPSGSYEVMVSATAGRYTGHANYTSALSVGSAPTSSGFFNEKIVGLPLWILFVIIGIVIVAIVMLMVVLPRMSRGKLVECGECGELIPESATQCPKCGAEFESELVRCSRCGSTIPANSKVCPECAAQLLGNPGDTENDPERQGYEDFVERYRLAAKKDLGDNFSEGAFWDWWKRQVTYLSFSQWRLQQSQGPRSGTSAPPADNRGNEPEVNMVPPALSGSRAPGQVSAPPTGTPATAAAGAPPRYTPPAGSGPAPASAPPASYAAAPPATAAPPTQGMRPCSSCAKEIPDRLPRLPLLRSGNALGRGRTGSDRSAIPAVF